MPAGVSGFDHLYFSKPTTLNERSIFSCLSFHIPLMLGWRSVPLRVAIASRNPLMPTFLRSSMGLIMYPGRGSSSSEMIQSNSSCRLSCLGGSSSWCENECDKRIGRPRARSISSAGHFLLGSFVFRSSSSIFQAGPVACAEILVPVPVRIKDASVLPSSVAR